LAVCCNGRGLASRERRETQHRLRIACTVRMVRQACCGDVRTLRQQCEDRSVQGLPARFREGVLECAARELVPEGEGAVLEPDHAHSETILDRGFVGPDSLCEE